jgi:PAS domain S-box-containing protein
MSSNRILVVDDNPLALKLCRIALERAGWDVQDACDGRSALAAWRAAPPDVALVDLVLPDGDGLELLRTFREADPGRHVPVVAMTAMSCRRAEVLHAEEGFDGFLGKPVAPSELVRFMRGYFHAPAASGTDGGDMSGTVMRDGPAQARLPQAEAMPDGFDVGARQLELQIAKNVELERRNDLLAARLAAQASVAEAIGRSTGLATVMGDIFASLLDACGVAQGALFLSDAGVLRLHPRSTPPPGGLDASIQLQALAERADATGLVRTVPSSAWFGAVDPDVIGRTSAGVAIPLASPGQRVVVVVAIAEEAPDRMEAIVAMVQSFAGFFQEAIRVTGAISRAGRWERRHEVLMENASDAIALMDSEGAIIEVNRRREILMGVPREQQIGRRFWELGPPDERAWHEAFQRVLETGSGSLDGVRIVRPDGHDSIVDLSATVIAIGDERLVLSIARDVTERHRLEAHLRSAQRLESIGLLAGGLAHDINNILTIILFNSEMLQEGMASEDPRLGQVREMREAGERAARLTRQLLTFSRQRPVETTAVDVNKVVGGLEKMLRTLIGEDIEFTTQLMAEPSTVTADLGQIEQVIMNLVVNARDAMPSGGNLTIETSIVDIDGSSRGMPPGLGEGRHVVLCVKDTGLGMDAQTHARMFEPFFTTKEAGRGTGLGLATVHGIVKQSGGEIWADTELGYGTTFRVLLPCASGAASRGVSRGGARVERARGFETALIVEDDAGVRQCLARVLRDAGYSVLETSGGFDALRACAEPGCTIDVVVTDLVMPGLNGLEVGRAVQAHHPDVKVLYMSGFPDHPILRGDTIEAGAGFMSKPLRPRGLLAGIRQVLDASPPCEEHAPPVR